MRETIGQLIRFVLVGVANTIVGLGIILILTELGVAKVPANMMGYACGLVVSFILNSRYTFKTDLSVRRARKFLAVFGICYLLNLGVLLILADGHGVDERLAQTGAVFTYTIAFFILSRLFVFNQRAERRP